MQQRFSLIQEMIDTTNAIGEFKNQIRQLNEKYDIEQETFGIFSNGWTATPAKIHEGYMKVRNEFNTLEEALKDFNSITDVLYIVDSKTIYTGEYSSVILEKKEDERQVDLSNLRFIE